jgi:hypothetical protein
LSFILLALVYLSYNINLKTHLKTHILGLEVKSKQSEVCSSLGTLCELENQKRIEKLISPPLKQNFKQIRRGQRLFVETPLSCLFSNTFLVKGPIHAHMSKLEVVFEFCFLSSEN